MRPAGMLSHRRRDGDTFCDDEGDWVDRDGDGSWSQARDGILQGRRDIVFTFAARHGDGLGILFGVMRRSVGRRGGSAVNAVGICTAMCRL